MRRSKLKGIGVFFLAAILSAPAWGANSGGPGTLNYVEGQASIGSQSLDSKSVGSIEVRPGQSLNVESGKAEVLLTPGAFLRLGDHSSMQMISAGLLNTEVKLEKGRATVEIAEIHPQNSLRVLEDGVSIQPAKTGFYAFDADQGQLRVFEGMAVVQEGGRRVEVKGGRELNLNANGSLHTHKFDKDKYQDDLIAWSRLRSSYLAEANVDAAR